MLAVVLLLAVCAGYGDSSEPVIVLTSTEPLGIASVACRELNKSNEVTEWSCSNLQTALELVSQYNWTNRTVSVLVPAGDHLLESPVHVGSTSVELVGAQSPTASPLTSIQCTYHIDVDQDQLFNLSYVYTDYSLYFNYSKSVSISNVAMSSCQFPLRLDTIGTVRITNSTFQLFEEAVLDIYNTADTMLLGCVFFNNRGTGISRNSFRGNTGAVSIGFNNIELDHEAGGQPQIIVSYCNFTNNRATAEAFFRSTNSAFFSRIFTGRGGGLGLFVNESLHYINAEISDNIFQDNYARSFGGGLYMVMFGTDTQNIVLVSRNTFVNNVALLGAGGLLMTFFSVGVRDAPHTTIVSDCTFSGNKGESGGGVLTYIANEVNSFFKLERCNFSRNRGVGSINDFGSAYAVWLVGHLRERQSLTRYNITDCIFEDHEGSNGVVSIGYAPFAFYGRNIFRRNNGTSSLNIIGSLVEVYGTMTFLNNAVNNEAALELLSLAQVRLHNGALMEFEGNSGRLGASIIVRSEISLVSFTALPSNSRCFMLYEDSAIPPSKWANVSVKFRSNTAILSSSVYASSYRDCTWSSQTFPYFDNQSILKWPLWDLGNDSKNTGYENIYSQKYHIGTEAVAIDTPSTSITAWPGFKFTLPLAGWDEFNNPTSVATRLNYIGQDNNLRVSFVPEVVVIEPNGESSKLVSDFSIKYRLSQSNIVQTNESVGTVVLNAPFQDNEEVRTDELVLFSELCPGGYELVNGSTLGFDCACLEKTVDGIVHCELDQQSIIIKNGLWVSAIPSINSHNHMMHFYTCPAGYCRCVQNSSLGTQDCVYLYVNNNPDAQCSCNRHGILCGDCEDGGVSVLFDRCVSCSNAFIVLVPLLVVIQVALFITIVLIDRQFWSILYPFTFYVQVFSFSGAYFHETFLSTGQYLHYLGSAMSFYFPYDFCLLRNLDPLISYVLRYLPLLVALFVVSITVIMRYVKWRRKLKHHGVWIIVLLIYSHTVYTSMSILNCPLIVDRNEITTNHWFHNGNLVCFTGRHLPVALLSIFILLLCLLAIPIVWALSTGKLRHLNGWEWTEHFQQPLLQGYKEKYRWWAAVELNRRALFIFLVILFPRQQVAVLFLLCILLVIYGFTQPYKNTIVNIMEPIVLLNSIILLKLISSGVLDPYYSPSQESSTSSSDSCKSSGNTTVASWILLPFYYFPVLLLLIFLIPYFRRKLRNYMMKTKKFVIKEKKDTVTSDQLEMSYTYISSGDISGTEIFLPDRQDGNDMMISVSKPVT